MPDDVILRPIGRVSEPSHNVAPKGSLLEADNCVIREAGVLAPTPGLVEVSSGAPFPGSGVWNISPQFNNGTQPEQLVHKSNGSTAQQGAAKASALSTELTYLSPDGTNDSVEYFDHGDGLTMAPMYLARENLYVGDGVGVYKWENTDATELVRVWDESPPFTNVLVSATTPAWLTNGNHVAYTAVVVLEDANGVITRSSPSARYAVANSSGSARSVTVNPTLQGSVYGHPNFHSVEVYRTSQFASNVELPNEHGLVATLLPADFGTVEGNIRRATHADTLADDQRGAALYTDSSQGGLVAGNIAPPEHLYHASFKGHEFWGNVTERFLWPEINVDLLSSLREGPSTTYTAGLDTVTVASATGIEVGMLASHRATPGTAFTLDTYVTNVSGTTVTMSNAATASGTATFDFWVSAYVRFADGSTERVALFPRAETGTYYLSTVDVHGSEFAETNSLYGATMRLATAHRPGRGGDAQMWVNTGAVDTNVASLAVSSGAPTTGGTAPAQSTFKRRIYWSKLQEPEHTTLANFQDVGSAGDIVGLASLRDALIILKTDGIYRLTGSNGNWRIDPIDTSVRPIGGRSTATMDNACYTLGNRGLLRVTPSGVQNLTDNIVGDWFGEQNGSSRDRLGRLRTYLVENDGYHPPAMFAAANQRDREYALLIDADITPSTDGGSLLGLLVYNAQTSAFTTWDLSESGATWLTSIGVAEGDYSDLTRDQVPGFVFGRRKSDVHTFGTLFLQDNLAGVEPYTQNIRFRALSEGDPTHVKLWSELAWDVAAADTSAGGIATVFQDGEGGADVAQAVSGGASVDEIRVWPPIAVSRSTKIVAGLTGAGITLYGVRLSFTSSGKGTPL